MEWSSANTEMKQAYRLPAGLGMGISQIQSEQTRLLNSTLGNHDLYHSPAFFQIDGLVYLRSNNSQFL